MITSGFKRYFANTSWLFFERTTRIGIGLLVMVYVARYLGPENFGLLSYTVAFVGLFAAIAMLGLDSVVVREIVSHPEKRDEIMGSAFILKLIGSILMWIAIAIGVQFSNNDTYTNLLIAVVAGSYLFQAFNVIDFNFQAIVLSRYVVQVQFVQVIISSVVKLLLIWIEASLFWFVSVILLDAFILGLGLAWNYTRNIGRLRDWKVDMRIAIALLRDSWPLIFAGIAVAIYMQIDQVMIKQMMDSQSVGEYAVAVRVAEAWNFIPMVLCSSLFPAIANAKLQSERLYLDRLQQLYDLMIWVALPISFALTFSADYLVAFLFGAEFAKSGEVLSLYVWVSVVIFLGVASSQYLTAENLLRLSFYRTACGAILNVILNLLLIPDYGIEGAAIATLASYSAATFMVIFFRRTRAQALNMLRALFLLSSLERLRKSYAG